jgi:hypothetical protein
MNEMAKILKFKTAANKKGKQPLIASSLVLMISVALISIYVLSPTSSAQLVKNADSQMQFKIDIAYAYVGQHSNLSIDSNGKQMFRLSQYPSSLVLNITRLPGVLAPSCDAIIEVYNVEIATEKGESEDYAYIIGTNYNESYSGEGLPTMIQSAHTLLDSDKYLGLKGDAHFRWKDNESKLSHPIGSICYFTTVNSSLGLWREGVPNQLSITISRIGYVTIGNNTTTIYKDADTTKTTNSVNLTPYNNGFICNNAISPEKLSQTDLFSPIAANEITPGSIPIR